MKKIETTHLKASRVGGVDRWRQRQDREVRVWESKFEKVESIREGRDGSEVWISGKPKAWVWGMDRRLGLGSTWEFDEMGQLVGWWRRASMGWWRWGSSRVEGSEIERWEFERVSLRELRESRVFCLRACP